MAAEHALFCEGLRGVLKVGGGFQVVHHTSNGVDALQRTREMKPHILLLDLAMTCLPESQAVRETVAVSSTSVVALTTSIEQTIVPKLVALGARGVVLKNANADLLVRAIRAVAAGVFWLDRESVTDLTHALERRCSATTSRTPANPFGLTQRELEIIAAVAAAYTNKDIAQLFSIRETTVKHHLTSIFDKTGVSTRLELAMFAVSKGLRSSPAVAVSMP